MRHAVDGKQSFRIHIANIRNLVKQSSQCLRDERNPRITTDPGWCVALFGGRVSNRDSGPGCRTFLAR